ncbi:MAG: hypothetical protein Q4A01_12585 [Coriobacteriales bacterium]|nr:hypothetical protein [Coriobacteriales bacterium]
MNHKVVLAVLNLLTGAFELLKAVLDLRGSGRGARTVSNDGEEVRKRPRHLRK